MTTNDSDQAAFLGKLAPGTVARSLEYIPGETIRYVPGPDSPIKLRDHLWAELEVDDDDPATPPETRLKGVVYVLNDREKGVYVIETFRYDVEGPTREEARERARGFAEGIHGTEKAGTAEIIKNFRATCKTRPGAPFLSPSDLPDREPDTDIPEPVEADAE